jgi:hypothetical protein
VLYCETFTTVREHKEICLGSDAVDSNYHLEFEILQKFTNPWVLRNADFRRDVGVTYSDFYN